MIEKYFVGSNGDEPLIIFFDAIDAFVSGYKYLDSFDESGLKVAAYKFIDGEYITIF